MEYKCNIRESSLELSARDRLKYKDTGNSTQFEELTREGEFIIPVVKGYVILDIFNEKSKDNQEYVKIIIIDDAENSYITGSDSFIRAFLEIHSEMGGEPYGLVVRQADSKNYSGKKFITCSIL